MKKFYFFLITLCSIQIFSQITISKDNSFGNSGEFTTVLNSSTKIISANILVLPDHSILYIINGNEKDYILKLKPNGILDTTFANNGMLTFEQNNTINAVMQGSKIIVYFGPKAPEFNTYEGSKILRFDENGILDATFGENGAIIQVTESFNSQSLSVLVLADLSLMVNKSNSTFPKKYTANGQLETSFGNEGEMNYSYHFPLGQFANGKIATCDISSLSSSVYSFFDLYSLTTNSILNLNNTPCHYFNDVYLQNKTNLSTRITADGTVYSVFEYLNYPLPDFSRLVVIKNQQLDADFAGKGFVSSNDYEQFVDSGYGDNTFLVLSQKLNQKSLLAYSAAGDPLTINNKVDFDLQSGNEIEVHDHYILVNSVLPDSNQNLNSLKIEKFIMTNEKLSTANNSTVKIEIENPVKDFLNIRNADNAVNFEIYNMEGRKISEANNFKKINTRALLKGNYIIKISMKNGEIFSKMLTKN